jgi:hypothetical protein
MAKVVYRAMRENHQEMEWPGTVAATVLDEQVLEDR